MLKSVNQSYNEISFSPSALVQSTPTTLYPSLEHLTGFTITLFLPWNLNCTYTMLITTPIAATIIIVSALMSKSWWMMRSNARYMNTPVITQMMAILSNAPRISKAQINYNLHLLHIIHYSTCCKLHTVTAVKTPTFIMRIVTIKEDLRMM
jgi:hypothetical protein